MASRVRGSTSKRSSGAQTVQPTPVRRRLSLLDLEGAGEGTPRKSPRVKGTQVVATSPSKKETPGKKKSPEDEKEDDKVDGTLLELERAWLREKLAEGVEKTAAVTMAIKKKLVARESDVCDEMVKKLALEKFLEKRKDGTFESLVKVFEAVVGKDDLELMKLSEKALLEKDEGQVASVRSERVKSLVNEVVSLINDLPAEKLEELQVGEEWIRLLAVVREKGGDLELEQAPVQQKRAKEAGKGEQAKVQAVPKSPREAAAAAKSTKNMQAAAQRGKRSRGEAKQLKPSKHAVVAAGQKKKKGASKGKVAPAGSNVANAAVPQDDGEEVQERVESVEVDQKYLNDLVERLEENVMETKNLLDEYKDKNKPVPLPKDFMAPTPDLATGENGLELWNDLDKLDPVLSSWSETSVTYQGPLEQLGVLLRWWRIARRALSIAGIFKVLRSSGNGEAPLKKRYEAKVAVLEEAAARAQRGAVKMYRYRHARTYEMLGIFLAKHPDLINQTLLVTLSDWTKVVVLEEGEDDDDDDNDAGDAGEEKEIATGDASDEEEGDGKGKGEEEEDDDEDDGNAGDESPKKKAKAKGGKAKKQQLEPKLKKKPRKKYLMDFVDELLDEKN